MLNRYLSLATCAALALGACNQQQSQSYSPPPQPQPPATYSVLFDTGSSALSNEAMATIQQAAGTYRARSGTSVLVAGHTDTVGSPRYNMLLSQRRAVGVTAALVGAGVPRDAIITRGYGETNLPQQTSDQVPLQANRSVQIAVAQLASSTMTDAQYCRVLMTRVRDISRGRDPVGALGKALSDCQQSQEDYGIPFMTQFLTDNRVPVPPRA